MSYGAARLGPSRSAGGAAGRRARFAKEAEVLGCPAAFGDILDQVNATCSPDVYSALLTELRAKREQIRQGALFSEIGVDAPPLPPWPPVTALAQVLARPKSRGLVDSIIQGRIQVVREALTRGRTRRRKNGYSDNVTRLLDATAFKFLLEHFVPTILQISSVTRRDVLRLFDGWPASRGPSARLFAPALVRRALAALRKEHAGTTGPLLEEHALHEELGRLLAVDARTVRRHVQRAPGHNK